MRLLPIFLGTLLFITACKNSEREKELTNDLKSEYPRIVDSLGVQNLYNKTKWNLYCLYCDDTIIVKNKAGLETFASKELKFDTLILSGDSLEINLKFQCGELPCDEMMKNDVLAGIVYRYGTDSILCYSSNSTLRYLWVQSPVSAKSRLVDPLQPDVIKYINDNRTKLNTWFYNEAVRRGVLTK